MNYRKEIDGLRALAVLPVIFFHAGFDFFSGGFVGVDVFFVISGYLITSLILADLEVGRFSIVRFYERRARRILPALFVVMAFCIPLAWLILPDHELIGFGRSLVGVSTFVSNFLFWKETGYFDTAAEFKPLLHTWSLSVEEQYYFFVPLIILFVWRFFRGAMFSVFLGLAVVSLMLAEYGATRFSSATFFLLHTRMWELMVGGLAAFFVLRPQSFVWNNVLSFAGFVMICLSVVLMDENVPFPGLYALFPVIGTALVLVFAVPGTLVCRVLGFPAFVWVGLVSYSAYLWHQPLFAYARAFSVSAPSVWMMCLLSVVSVFLGFLSFKFIERPFRDQMAYSRKSIFLLSGVGLLLFVLIGLAIQNSSVIKSRVTISGDNFKELSRKLATNVGLGRECTKFTVDSACTTGANPVALLWGDSYAMHLALAISESKTKLPFSQMTKSACAPILGVAAYGGKYDLAWGRECIEYNEKVFSWLKGQEGIRYVIMSSPFRQLSASARLSVSDGTLMSKSGEYGFDQFVLTINRVRALGKIPVIFSPTPSPRYNIGKCFVRSRVLGIDADGCNFPLVDNVNVNSYLALKKIEREHGVKVIWLSDLICPEGVCLSNMAEVVIYRDHGHLSREGSAYLGKKYDVAGLILKPF